MEGEFKYELTTLKRILINTHHFIVFLVLCSHLNSIIGVNHPQKSSVAITVFININAIIIMATAPVIGINPPQKSSGGIKVVINLDVIVNHCNCTCYSYKSSSKK